MDERQDRLGELFERAIELSPDERRRFVETCTGDPAIRSELRSLLAAHERTPNLLDRLAGDVVPAALSAIAADNGVDGPGALRTLNPRSHDSDPIRRPMGPDAERRRIETTRWSVVLAADGSDSARARAALETLCETYWYPVYAFIRRAGHSREDARDLTQEFFARVLERSYFSAARPERGRFRSFLLASLRHFLSNERDRRNAIKRGGGKPLLPLEFDDGESRWQLEPVDESTPDRIYERRWATTVLQVAMRRLEEAQARAGREVVFKQLKELVFSGDVAGKYGELAAKLSMTEGALRVAVHRLRRQFGAMLRETIAETVERNDEVDQELRYLLKIVGGGSSSR